MLQTYSALCEGAVRIGGEYGPAVGLVVLLFVGVGIALRLIARVLSRGGPGGG
jgi:hypothetical protein